MIGPGGKNIRGIQEETGAKLDVEDDGTVTIASMDAAGAEEAKRRVEALCQEIKVGNIYEGKVTSIKEFGAFIEIMPGRDGLCHISELDDGYVGRVDDVVKVGDRVKVKVIAIDDQDRVKLQPQGADAGRGRPPPTASARRARTAGTAATGGRPRRAAGPGRGPRPAARAPAGTDAVNSARRAAGAIPAVFVWPDVGLVVIRLSDWYSPSREADMTAKTSVEIWDRVVRASDGGLSPGRPSTSCASDSGRTTRPGSPNSVIRPRTGL